MTKKGAAGVRSVVMPAGHFRSVQIGFSDGIWQIARSAIPHSLDVEAERKLKDAVVWCCSNYLSGHRLLDEGARTAASIRRSGGKQAAPLESLARHLEAAAQAWLEVRGMHDDRLGPLSDLGDQLPAMAKDAERRLAALRKLKATKPVPVRKLLIRALAKACKDVGLQPTVTGRVYEQSAPTWFQEFVAAVNDCLLGMNGWGAPDSYTRNALFAEIAKAMSGDAK